MSITGTIIFDDDGKPQPLTAMTTNEDLIHALLHGGTAKIYTCNDGECLKATIGEVTISAENSLSGQVNKMLQSIGSKAWADEALTEKEKGFITSTSVPVLRYLVDPLSLGVSDSVIYQLSDYISFDILIQYMQEVMQQARVMLASKSYPDSALKPLQESMANANRQLAIMQSRVQVQQDALMVVERQMGYMRQQLSGRLLDRYQNNYRFSGGM